MGELLTSLVILLILGAFALAVSDPVIQSLIVIIGLLIFGMWIVQRERRKWVLKTVESDENGNERTIARSEMVGSEQDARKRMLEELERRREMSTATFVSVRLIEVSKHGEEEVSIATSQLR